MLSQRDLDVRRRAGRADLEASDAHLELAQLGLRLLYYGANGAQVLQDQVLRFVGHAKSIAGQPSVGHSPIASESRMSADAHDPVGIYFGTTSGEVWGSRDEGARWKCLARNLPHIYAVEAAYF